MASLRRRREMKACSPMSKGGGRFFDEYGYGASQWCDGPLSCTDTILTLDVETGISLTIVVVLSSSSSPPSSPFSSWVSLSSSSRVPRPPPPPVLLLWDCCYGSCCSCSRCCCSFCCSLLPPAQGLATGEHAIGVEVYVWCVVGEIRVNSMAVPSISSRTISSGSCAALRIALTFD